MRSKSGKFQRGSKFHPTITYRIGRIYQRPPDLRLCAASKNAKGREADRILQLLRHSRLMTGAILIGLILAVVGAFVWYMD